MSAPTEQAQWHVSVDGKRQGPYTLEQMKQMAREGRLPANAAVWHAGMEGWQPWRKVPELALSPMAEIRVAAAGGSQGTIVDYLVFRRMLAPLLIQGFFWIGVVICVFMGLSGVFVAVKADTILGILLGLVWLVLGPLVWRLICENLIVLFRINETLTDIKNLTARR